MRTGNLSQGQRRAIAALVQGATLPEAAQAAGCTVRTLYRWRKTPVFAAALNAADYEQMAVQARALAGATGRAVEVLLGIMDDPRAGAALRLRAADLVLTHRAKLAELVTLAERIAALEARL